MSDITFKYSVLNSTDTSRINGMRLPAGKCFVLAHEAGLDNVTFTVIPVPASIWLFGGGLLALTGASSRKRLHSRR